MMLIKSIKNTVHDLLQHAGVTINEDQPWDIQEAHEGFYSRILAGGSLTLGESYMDGW
jgi:cyclopropane-fatty-acyl-phospholipid synthase